MKKIIITVLLMYVGLFPLYAQTADSIRVAALEQQNKALQEQLSKMEQKTHDLYLQVTSNSEKINLLGVTVEQKVGGLHEQMDSIDSSYDSRMNNTENAVEDTKTNQHKSVLWGIVIAVVLALVSAIVYLLLRIRIAKKSNDIELLRARADDLNRQIVERMDKELEELSKVVTQPASTSTATTAEPDHTLVKALADRITFMEMTLYRMDPSVKGHKHLTRSIKQMKDNLLANGYEIIDMLGKDYVEGMKASPSFNDDDSLERGKRIITGITKPQINFKGQMIQAAQITVSQNI